MGSIRVVLPVLLLTGCLFRVSTDADKNLSCCIEQAVGTLRSLSDSSHLPRSIEKTEWKLVNYRNRTCGFWPGILWYAFEYTNDQQWKWEATRFSRSLFPLAEEITGQL